MPASQFLGQLAGVSDPEAKRKIIGREFVEVFQAEAPSSSAGAKGAKWLAQGTIYPDVIEIGRRQEQEGRHDQEPPQRRRPARARWA